MPVKTNFKKAKNKCFAALNVLFTLVTLVAPAQNKKTPVKTIPVLTLQKKLPADSNRYTNLVYPDLLKGNEEHTIDYIKNFSNNRRNYLIRMHTKGQNFFPKTSSILKKYSLPEELKILLILESAYNGNAVSKAGAVGYWQIMDEVAREYGMKYIARGSAASKSKLIKRNKSKGQKPQKSVAKLKDDRKNFIMATHTAARYLHDRSRNLAANWLLVVASYNCGIGNVWNAMKRSGKTDPSFWDIKRYLPLETRNYVMNFITLNVIFHNYEMFAKKELSFVSYKKILIADKKTLIADEPPQYSDR
ncbi:MAG: lytic transglycosylase domain-containing protein [Ferruginibacter sp.]